MKRILLSALLCLLLLCACGGGGSTEYMGKTSVLLEDAVLGECYGGQSDEEGRVTWSDLPETELHKGDIVLFLKEEGGQSQVYVPTGDSPLGLYGSLPSSVLSREPEDLAQGNLANADGRTAYASQEGEGPEKMTGLVRILERQENWCRVQPFAGGEERSFWIHPGDLSYHLDAIILARKG